jgi:type IV secretory pathway TrbF-like protein
MKTAEHVNGATEIPAHPILDAANTSFLNSLLLQAEQRTHNWQLTAWWSLTLSTVLLTAVVVLSLARKEHYYATYVDKTGATFTEEAPVDEAHSPTVVRLTLETAIVGLRAIVADQSFQAKITNRAYRLCRTNAQVWLRQQIEEEKPDEMQKRGISRYPRDISIVQQAANTFALNWVEDVQDVTGNKSVRMSGVMVIELKSPGDLTSDERLNSPNGIFITSLSWSSHGEI